MSHFAIEPVFAMAGGIPPTSEQHFPKLVLVRWNGADVGYAATINFVGTAFTLTRGAGVDAPNLTLEID